MIRMLFICAALFFSAVYRLDASDNLFNKANRAYAEGSYEVALDTYVTLVDSGESNAALFYNLGNTYYKLKKTGAALLWLERARALTPADPDVVKNIETIRKNAGIIVDEEPVLDRYLSFLDFDVSLIVIFVMIIFLSLGILLKNIMTLFASWLYRRTFGAAYISIIILMTFWMLYQYKHIDKAVVVIDDAPLLISPYEKADSAGTMKDGSFVRVVDSHGAFRKIESTAGHQGWMSNKDVTLIIPVQ